MRKCLTPQPRAWQIPVCNEGLYWLLFCCCDKILGSKMTYEELLLARSSRTVHHGEGRKVVGESPGSRQQEPWVGEVINCQTHPEWHTSSSKAALRTTASKESHLLETMCSNTWGSGRHFHSSHHRVVKARDVYKCTDMYVWDYSKTDSQWVSLRRRKDWWDFLTQPRLWSLPEEVSLLCLFVLCPYWCSSFCHCSTLVLRKQTILAQYKIYE